ncbi:hypothetical protein GH714_004614 [Hevea brasiliensis]|uniref:Transposase MuDR plant domain-containing protein n=1 Tax=Hevea brasiliensis TaxID=3981 RepID=A0A6A6NBQ9_HEVBR|nr:hypothetical protein GH714_004614 [Hevea brasiliensis]
MSSSDLGSYEFKDDTFDESENDSIMRKSRKVRFNKNANNLIFYLGMEFANAKEFKKAIGKYSIATRIEKGQPLIVKTFKAAHKCYRIFKNLRVTAQFLANYFKRIIYTNFETKVKELQDFAKEELRIHVSYSKCKRVKRLLVKEMDGSYKMEFGQIKAYVAEIERSNPRLACKVELSIKGLRQGKRVFYRMFVYFDACKKGWLGGYRPIKVVDGAFLKGICKE